MIATLRFADRDLFFDKLAELGVPCNRNAERVEEEIGQCSTPPLTTTVGIVRSVWLTDAQFALLPEITSPDFLCDWSEDAEDADGNPLPWPEYDIQGTDINGNPVTYRQGAGRFA